MQWGTAHMTQSQTEREINHGWRTVLSSFSTDDFPGSYSKMLLGSARYFLVSTFLSGGSHSFLWRGGWVREVSGRGGVRDRRQPILRKRSPWQPGGFYLFIFLI